VSAKFVLREDAQEWERVAYAEVLIPETPNSHSDYWTKEGIREAMYEFAKKGFGIDLDHDNIDRSGDIKVVESFIARANDPDFIEGSWVVGVYIGDENIWQDVLNGSLNGYSYEALVSFLPATMTVEDDGIRQGVTEPSTEDGHVHGFLLMVDDEGYVLQGGTDEVNGHSHTISGSVVTDDADGHNHRYNSVTGVDGK